MSVARIALSVLALTAGGLSAVFAADISGTWVAKTENPMMGEVEYVYELKVDASGKITGSQRMPFGDSPIIDGKINGNQFELTVQQEFFGNLSNVIVKGTIEGETLSIVPPMPGPPGGAGRGRGGAPGAGTGFPPDGPPPPGAPGMPPGAPGMGPGGPGGRGRGGFSSGPLTFRRGTPTPSYRAPSVDYTTLPKVELPPRRNVPSNNLAKTPPMGWNSWNKFRTQISDKTVREIADAMVSSGMKAAGYEYVNIDDGWQWKRDAQGKILPTPNFPDMKALADYVHSKGLKLGIYSSPGPRTCGGYEGSYGHEEEDAKTYAQWGIDYLKYDWCSASRIWKDEDMPAAYQKMGEAIRAAGRPMVYSLCQYGRYKVQEWGPGVAGNLWRTTGDIRDAWDSMANIGFSQSELSPYAAPGHWNDPDMLEVGNGRMSTREYITHFTLWAMLAAPLIAGNDIRSMPAEIHDILTNKEVIAINQDKLGKAARRISKNGETEVWLRPLSGDAYAVALFNRGAADERIEIKWEALELPSRPRVRDLWAHKDLGPTPGGFSSTVPSHGVTLIRVSN
jgi:alpha-galactosidase